MGTIKTDPEPAETRTHIVMRNIRLAVAGDTRAEVRRILLYVVAVVATVLSGGDPTPIGLALVAIVLLLATDQLL